MDFRYTLQELAFTYKDTEEWDRQMRLLSLNPLLYLEEYKILPEDIYLWKQDEELHPAASGRNTGKIPWGPEGRYKKAGFFPFSIRGYVCGKPLLHRKESFAYF